MSESTGTAFDPPVAAGAEMVHEAYSFACMRCSHAWEQAYDIEHHIDGDGRTMVIYYADGRRVPSPLSRPTCEHCDGHLVRIMRPGRVNNPDLRATTASASPVEGGPGSEGPDPTDRGSREPGSAEPRRHWHLPQLFHRRPDDEA